MQNSLTLYVYSFGVVETILVKWRWH